MREVGIDLREGVARRHRHRLGAAPRAHERQGAHALHHEVGEQARGLRRGGTPGGRVVLPAVLGQRRLPQRERRGSPWRRVGAHGAHVEADEPRRRARGVAGGRRREDERGARAVAGRHPLQSPQHVGDVRPEHAAVDVALVDDDVPQRTQERRPPLVAGQERAVQQVRVGEDVARVRPDPGALLVGGVAVVRRHAQPVEVELGDRAPLVVRQRLGRREIESGGAAAVRRPGALEHGGERGHQVGQGLPARRPRGHHHVPAVAGEVRGVGLVRPRQCDAPPGERVAQVGVDPVRPADRGAGARRDALDVEQPAVAAGGEAPQQLLGVGCGHALILAHAAHVRVACARVRAWTWM